MTGLRANWRASVNGHRHLELRCDVSAATTDKCPRESSAIPRAWSTVRRVLPANASQFQAFAGARLAQIAISFGDFADLIAVIGAGGLVLGAMIGLMFRAETDRRLLENVVLGSGLGLILGTAFALAVGIVYFIAA
jgi:hypothetical protein